MQRSKVTNIPHVVFTDHWIRARPQADSTESRVVEESRRHSADGSRIKMVSFWTRDASKREQSRSAAIAQIRYFDLHPADRSILDLKAAVQTLQRITKSNSTDVEAWFVLGVAQFHLSNMKAAAENYRRAAECPGGCEKAYAHAGEAYEGIGMFEQAKEMYEKSISQWPEFLAPYDRLAALHMREGRFPEAIELLRHELELNPQRAATWNQLGMTSYMHDQDFEKARAAIRKSLELNPDLLQAYVALGFMCSREGRRDEALEAYDAALRISPDHLESLLGAASLHEEAGNLARASELLSHAAQTAPTHPEVMQRLRRRTVRQR
jgi:tetratricopeptide (TPR) repeat protein